MIRICFLFLALILFGSLMAPAAFAVEKTIGPSGEAVPRFASLRADLVNVRRGPGRDHKILWVFKKLGLPVKVVSEYEEWREIEDQAGAKGWVFHSLLSRRRTAVTLDPQEAGSTYFSLHDEPEDKGEAVAKLGKGVIVHLISCTGSWCNIAVNNDLRGWISQANIWGLFEREPLN